MAGTHRHRFVRTPSSPGRATVRPGRIQVERLEDRTAPAIIQVGLPTWLEAGPAPTINSQVSGMPGPPNNPVTGAIESLAPHPTDPNILFAAGVNGGIWRTLDALSPTPDWEPLTDQAPSLSVASLAMNPDNPDQLLVGFGRVNSTFLGLGDAIGAMVIDNATRPSGGPDAPRFQMLAPVNGVSLREHTFRSAVYRNEYMLLGSMLSPSDQSGRPGEVFRSLDGGRTFTSLSGQGGLGELPAAGEDVFDIVADPADRRRVFVVTQSGVYRTDDILAPTPVWADMTAPPPGSPAGTPKQLGFGPGTDNAQLTIHSSPQGHVIYVGVTNGGQLTNVAWSPNLGATWVDMDTPEVLVGGVPVVDATNASPIAITTAFGHGLATGDRVYISGVQGNLEANGVWTVTVTGATTFTLDGSAATGVYTGGGQVQRIVGVHPGTQSHLHFALAADPADPNVVYISGDRQELVTYGSPNGIGSTDYSGTVHRGTRTAPRSGGFVAPAPQWTPLTNNFALANGAPHADSRFLAVDAAGTLLEADDGGIYRRLDPRATGGAWVSVNGDLSVGGLYSARQDMFSNVVFGGTQDTGSIEQLSSTNPGGNTTWDTVLLGDGFWSEIDNSDPSGSLSHRYSMGGGTTSLFRRQYDRQNQPISSQQVMLADVATPTKLFSGYDPVDFQQGLFVRIALNTVDPRLMMLGGAKLYEDNNPDPALGLAGDVIAKVTPAGMTGRVSSLVYGGKENGQVLPAPASTRIAYVGTNSGQLFIRGPGGPFFQPAAPVPGAGSVVDIAVDPDDWRTAYVLREDTDPADGLDTPAIFMTADAGASWADVTGNLVGTQFVVDPATGLKTGFDFDANGNLIGGLSTHLTTLTLWDPTPGTTDGNEVLVAGGRGGIFRRVPGLSNAAQGGGDWTEYGIGLPNTTVTDATVQGNALVVATMGRGAWEIPDVSDSIGRAAELIIRGDATANRMSIQADPSNPAAVVIADDGLGTRLRADRNSVQVFRFEGLGGADTIELAANAQAAGGLSFVKFTLTVDAGGDAGDMLVISDAGRATPSRATITANTIGSGPGDTLFSGGSVVQYTGLQQGTLVLDLGPGAVDGNQVLVQSTSAFSTRVVGSAGADFVHLGSGAGAGDTGDLSGIGGVEVDGRVAGLDFLVISDYAAAGGNAAVLASGNTVTGFAGPNDGSTVTFANVGTVRLLGSTSPALPEAFRVQNPNAPVFEVYAFEGPDAVNVRSNAQIVNVHGGGGDDVLRVSSFAGDSDDGSLAGILGPLFVDAGPGDNRLVVSDFANPVAATYLISDAGIGGGTRNPILYAATGGRFFAPGGDGLLVRGSNAGNDTFHVMSALAGSQTAADGLGGADVFQVAADATRGDVHLRGSGGNDQFFVYPGFSGGAQASLRLSGGGDSDAATVFGLAKDDFATVTMTGPTAGRLTGIGAAVDFDTQERVGFDGTSGRNHLAVVNGTGTRFGTPTDPGSGIVYRPTGETAGEVRFGGGAAGVVEFRGINGKDDNGLVVSGAAADVLTVLGFSDDGLGSPLGEATAPNGSDAIDVTDRVVTLSNASRGYLRSVAVGPAIGAIVIKAGNEVAAGDRITVTPSAQVNILVDGGGPGRAANGDAIAINGAGGRTFRIVDDPAVGPRHTRAFLDSGTTVGFLNIEGNIDPATGLASGGLRSAYAVSADAGGGPRVAVYDAATKAPLFDGFVYDPSFSGGVRVAMGDVTGDGVPDVVAVAGLGGGPHVQVLDGVTFQSVASFFAYEPSYRGGLYVAAGDVTGDGVAEIITGTGLGGGPLVKVFDGTGRLLNGFFAFEESFRGGVRVGAGDLTGDGIADIVAAPGVGGGPLVRVFDANTAGVLTEFFTDDPTYRSGLYVAAGDLDGDSLAEIVVGPGGNSAPDIKVRRSRDGSIVRLGVYDVGVVADSGALPAVPTQVVTATGSTGFEDGGVRVAVVGFDPAAGPAQILAGRGAGFPARLHAYSLDPLAEVGSILAFDGFAGGVFVG